MKENKKVVVYYEDDGTLAIVVPSESFLKKYSINEIAKKDVPEGKPYKIIDAIILPSDGRFHGAWEVDMSTPDGYGIGQDAWFSEQSQQESGQ
jgi:hypothetical protein